MDVMLQKRCAKFIYVVPEGLRELMSDISREVIRSQPEHMYTFIADYLDAMMITRENARVAARLVDSIMRIATMTVGLLEQTGMSRDDADRMATIIQEAFKRYMTVRPDAVMYESREEEEDEEHEMIVSILQTFGDVCDQETAAAIIIQRAFREFKERHSREKQLLTGMIDWRVAARSAIYLYRRTGVTIEEANRAATLIKAAYKGYYTRRIMKRLLEEGRIVYEERGEDMYPAEDEIEGGDSELEELPAFKQFRDVGGEQPDYDIMSTKEIPKGPVEVAESVLGSVLKTVVPDSVHKMAPTVTSTAPTAGGTTGATTGTAIQPDPPPPTEATEPQSEDARLDTTQADVIPEIPHDYPEAEGEFDRGDTTADITEGLPTESGDGPQSMPGEVQQSMPEEFQQSMPGEVQESMPGEAQQSVPGEAQQTTPGEAQQSMPGEVQQSMPGEAQQSVPGEAPPSDVGEPPSEPATDATMEGITEPFTEGTTGPPSDVETEGA